MTSLCAKALLLVVLALPAAAQHAGKGDHRHRRPGDGGNVLQPATLTVSGATTLSGTLAVSGQATVSTAAVTGKIVFDWDKGLRGKNSANTEGNLIKRGTGDETIIGESTFGNALRVQSAGEIFLEPGTAGVTVSGATTLSSTVTVNGPATFVGRVALSSSNVGQVMISSSVFQPTGASFSQSFEAWESSGIYRVIIMANRGVTEGLLSLTFNGDTGANYDYAGEIKLDDSSAPGVVGNNAASCALILNATAGQALMPSLIEMLFVVNPFDNTRVIGSGTQVGQVGPDYVAAGYTGCMYDGAAAITSITITSSAGNIGGRIHVERIQ